MVDVQVDGAVAYIVQRQHHGVRGELALALDERRWHGTWVDALRVHLEQQLLG